MKQIITCICFAIITNCTSKKTHTHTPRSKKQQQTFNGKTEEFQFHAAVENDIKEKLRSTTHHFFHYIV